MELKRWRWWNCKFCFEKFRISIRVFRKLKNIQFIRRRSFELTCSCHFRENGLFLTEKVDSVLHEQSNQQHIIHEFKIRDFELQNLLPDQIYTGIWDNQVFETTNRPDWDTYPCPWIRWLSLLKLFFNQKIGQQRIRVTIILPLEYCVK